jgi:hypothetical protein
VSALGADMSRSTLRLPQAGQARAWAELADSTSLSRPQSGQWTS